ncbi:uncharacterized protein BDZ99DRAFT_267659 [Mytilinidion resinicola]|uniref:Uncharacterized protein n=1 Tax=Mytilinidion resinicola TaxID=574789 RepID=A0A6A6YVB5_9PEZI|nr:uncharacterized protein BDZ99DRAFT_267659 [Mytilinidion resinicola]KAF2812488.1 hypothetical protein BDZ99DRAFT_267659 [Mytilinidion resinicola]
MLGPEQVCQASRTEDHRMEQPEDNRPEGSARESVGGGVPGIQRDADGFTRYLRTDTSEVDVSEIRNQANASGACWPGRSMSPMDRSREGSPQRQSSVHGEADSNPRSAQSDSADHTNGYHSPDDHDRAQTGAWSEDNNENENRESLERNSTNESNTSGGE